MDREEYERLIKDAKSNSPPMFHPVNERHEGAWFPRNDAARIASVISHTWEDIQCLFEIRHNSSNDYKKRLLFKYIVIELRSVIEQLDKIQSIIFILIKRESLKNLPNGHVSNVEAEKITRLFKEYHSVKKVLEKDIIDIRNNIGAHRGNHPWENIMELWDKLVPEMFMPIFAVIVPLFECIIDLDIYDWSRIPRHGRIEICCSGSNQP